MKKIKIFAGVVVFLMVCYAGLIATLAFIVWEKPDAEVFFFGRFVLVSSVVVGIMIANKKNND